MKIVNARKATNMDSIDQMDTSEGTNRDNRDENEQNMTKSEVFARRDSINRTPPRKKKIERLLDRDRANSIPEIASTDLKWVFGQQRSAKRQREESSDDTNQDFGKMLEKIVRMVQDLQQLTESTSNTKLEIKRAAKQLNWQTQDLQFR